MRESGRQVEGARQEADKEKKVISSHKTFFISDLQLIDRLSFENGADSLSAYYSYVYTYIHTHMYGVMKDQIILTKYKYISAPSYNYNSLVMSTEMTDNALSIQFTVSLKPEKK